MKAYIEEVCAGVQETVRETAHAIWEYAELSLEEYRSSNYLTELLARAGFSVERGVAGYPTSFVAVFEHGTGGPAFGLLSEYDALPGLGDREGGRLVYQPWKGQQESVRPFRTWEAALLELMGAEPFPQQRFPAVEGFVPPAPGVSCWGVGAGFLHQQRHGDQLPGPQRR